MIPPSLARLIEKWRDLANYAHSSSVWQDCADELSSALSLMEQQEPVAWALHNDETGYAAMVFFNERQAQRMSEHSDGFIKAVPLFAHPPLVAAKEIEGDAAVDDGWISVKDRLPEAGKGISYMTYATAVVLVKTADRPDYPVTAHANLGDSLEAAGVAIPTKGASKFKQIAWYSSGRKLNNPFDFATSPSGKPFKDSAGYDTFLLNYFGRSITHWKPISSHPQHSQERAGWVWVPREPTEEMFAAVNCRGMAQLDAVGQAWRQGYQAMVDAAPKAAAPLAGSGEKP